MWTRTLSTTISTSPSSMRRIIPRSAGSPAGASGRDSGQDEPGHERPDHEPADVGEEGHAAAGLDDPERREPVDELEDEPEPQDDDRRDVDQLVEEAEEDERRDARPREQHEVGARASPRWRPTPRSSGPSRSGRWRPGSRPASDATQQVEAEETGPPEAVLDVVAEDPQVEHVAEQVQPAAVEELARHERGGLARQVVAAAPGGRQVGRDHAPLGDERLERRVAAAGEQAQLPGEDDEAGDDQRQRDERRPPRRIGVPERDHERRPVRASWSASGSPWRGSALGARQRDSRSGSPAPTSGTATRTAWLMPSCEIQTSVAGASLDAGDDVHGAEVRPVRESAGQAVLRVIGAVRPWRERRSGRSAGRTRRGRRSRRGGSGRRRASTAAPAGAACPRGLRVPALVLAATKRTSDAVVGREEVAVDVGRGHRRDVARGRQPGGRPGREAAPVGGRRVRPDLLLGRIDDVQVVEPARARPQERVRCP